MISPSEMKIIQIEITNSCIHHCSNCTRFCGLHEKNFMMSWDKFKHAVDSLKDFQGFAGVMGGKPLLNPQFPEMMPNWKTVVETSFYKHLIKLRRRITDSWNYRTSLILHRKRGEKKAAAVTDSQKKLSNIVLIPIYKQELSELEKQSLLQCATVFAKREICFFAPENIHFEYYQAMVPKARCEYFHSSFFQGISGYNRLMLSVDFYKRFNKYDHILIYQLDAWVFRDELDHWCSMGFDYIGAPLKASIFAARGKYVVGNGGFSLRKPAAFIRVLSSDGKMYNFNRLIEFCMIHITNMKPYRCVFPLLRILGFANRTSAILQKLSDGRCNEDYCFFELSERNHNGGLKSATVEQAMNFSWDRDTDFFSQGKNVTLPFGCHGITNKIFFEKIRKKTISNKADTGK